MITDTVKLIVAVLIAGLVVFGIGWIGDLKQRAAMAGDQKVVADTAAAVDEDQTQVRAQRVQVDLDVSGAREAFRKEMEDARREEPQLANDLDRPNPKRVRDAARKRRLARERSDGD